MTLQFVVFELERGGNVFDRIKSVSPYLVVIVVFIAAMIALLLFLRPNPQDVRQAVTDFFHQTTGCLIKVDSVRPDGMLLPAIRMSGLRLLTGDGEEVAKLRWLQADLSISDLISGGIGLTAIHLVEPELRFQSFEKCINRLHMPLIENAGQATPVSVVVERGKLLWKDNPFPRMQNLFFPSFEGRWDGIRNLKLFGYIRSLSDAQTTHPVHLSMRTGNQAVERFGFDFLAETEGSLVNAGKIASSIIRPQSETGRLILNLPQAGWLPFLSNTLFADKILEMESDLNFSQDVIRFENLEGKIGAESFQGQMNMYIQSGAASYLDTRLHFGVLDNDLAFSQVDIPQMLAGFSGLASRLAKAPFEIDFGVTAAGIAADNGEIARAPNLHLIAGHGNVTVDQFNIGLPGGTEISLLADFTPDASANNAWFASGGISLQSDNFRRSLTWLGYDMSSFSPDLWRQFSLAGNFEMDAQRFALSELDMRLDQSSLRGQMAYERNHGAGNPTLLEADLDFDQFYLDNYLQDIQSIPGIGGIDGDWGLLNLLERIDLIKSSPFDLRLGLAGDGLYFNENRHDQFLLGFEKYQYGLDFDLENYAVNGFSRLDIEATVDWEQKTPLVHYAGAYRTRDAAGLSVGGAYDLDLVADNLPLRELSFSFKGTGQPERLKQEFSGTIGDSVFKGEAMVLFSGEGVEFDLQSLTASHGQLDLSDVIGQVTFSPAKGVVVQNMRGKLDTLKLGTGKFSLDYHTPDARADQNFTLRLEDICDPEQTMDLKDWIVMNACISQAELSGNLPEGSLQHRNLKEKIRFDGTLEGSIDIEIIADRADIPVGLVNNLVRNVESYLPKAATNFKTHMAYTGDALELSKLQVFSDFTKATGKAIYDPATDRLELKMLFDQPTLDAEALNMELRGPVDNLNMGLKGNWLQE